MRYRDERLSVTIRDELAGEIQREFEFPDALVTITEVELSPKRDAAQVHISVLPDEAGPEVLKMLADGRRRLKHFLLKRLRIRIIPDLFFKIDRGPQNAAAVEKAALQRLSEEESGS